jgi:hypothetical protein
MTISRRPALRTLGVLVLLVALSATLAFPALATPAPKRPHPHRKPWPITLTVQTVPILAGLRVQFDDRTQTTDSRGRVRFTEEHNFAPHTLRLLDRSAKLKDSRARFVRWAGQRDPDQAFASTVRGLPMRMSYTVAAAFAVQRPIVASLVTVRGEPVDPSRISAITLRSGREGVVNVPASGQVWLDAMVPVYRNSAIVLEPEIYSLTSVIVGGTNTVDAGRQKFAPAKTNRPVFRTKFFNLTVTAHDLLFKGATGQAARVTYPDGSVHTLPFRPNGTVLVSDLPRGSYQVTVLGGGTPLPDELVLSRDTTVDLPIATHRDYGAIALTLLAIMAALALIGRGRRHGLALVRRLNPLHRRRRGATAPPDQADRADQADEKRKYETV